MFIQIAFPSSNRLGNFLSSQILLKLILYMFCNEKNFLSFPGARKHCLFMYRFKARKATFKRIAFPSSNRLENFCPSYILQMLILYAFCNEKKFSSFAGAEKHWLFVDHFRAQKAMYKRITFPSSNGLGNFFPSQILLMLNLYAFCNQNFSSFAGA